MIYKNGKEIKSIFKKNRTIKAVYKGDRCVWRTLELDVFPLTIEFTAEGGIKEVSIITKGGWEII